MTPGAALEEAIAAERGVQGADRLQAWTTFSQLANADMDGAYGALVTRIRELAKGATHEDLNLAELLCTKALSLQPQDPEIVTLLAARYIDRGLYQQAVVMLEDLRGGGHELGIIDRLLGQAAWRAGRQESAAAAFYRIAAAPGQHDWESLKLAAEYFRFEKSRPSLRMLLFQMGEMMDLRGEDDPEVCLWIAEWLIEDQDKDATKWLDRAANRLEPGSPLGWQVWRCRFGFEYPDDEAEYRRVTGGIFGVPPEESVKPLEQLTAKHPGFWEAVYFLGTCYRRMGRLIEAERAFRRVTEMQDYANAWLELGGVLGELRRPREALEASLKASQHFEGRNHVALCNAAAACLDMGDIEAAKRHLAAAKSLRPDSKAIVSLQEAIAKRETNRPWYRRMFGGGRR